MRQITGLLLGVLVFASAGNALAQVDCGLGGADCITTKYGLGFKEDFRQDEFPPTAFRWTDVGAFGADFPTCVGGPTPGVVCSTDAACGAGGTCKAGVSYFATRTSIAGVRTSFGGTCGPERNLGPLPGMVFLREESDCDPSTTGPTCVGGANNLKGCHLNAPPAIQPIECPGGTCTDNGGGCRVEIPLETADGGVTPVESTSEVKIFVTTYQARNPFTGVLYNLTAQTGNTLGGTSDDSNPICPITNIRRRPSMATRYLLPADRRAALGLPAGATYIRWDSAQGLANPAGTCSTANEPGCIRANTATNLRLHTDDTRLCCKPNVPGDCSALLQQQSAEYPLLTSRNCATTGRPFVMDDNIVGDWIFVGGRGSAFSSDPEYVNPGQIPGICRNNRTQDCYIGFSSSQCSAALNPYACCTGAGTSDGTCGDPCPTLDADLNTPGVQPDSCDLREGGAFRVQVGCARDSEFNTRRDCCPGSTYVLRGMPSRGCTLTPRLQYDGDPGKDCAVTNYGVNHRYDNDCNGVEDNPDLCPFFAEWDQDADSDGDCPGPACRGDECECGDTVGGAPLPPGGLYSSGEGRVTVSDLAAINVVIFNPLDSTKRTLLADTNNDIDITVSDIIGANIEIFRPDSSTCRQITPRQCGAGLPLPCCGDGAITTGEACDDANLTAGDGCNASCRVEFQFTCDNDPPPSVCTANP